MSTKATIAYGKNFHFYHEVLDDQYVYLELEGVPFEASYNRVIVPIPIHIWEVIRKYPGVDLSLVDKTDDELCAQVEQAVDERIAEYNQLNEDAKQRGLFRLFGALTYGDVELPREEQIGRGIARFTELRERQRQIKRAIEELK
jgi:hypothetical protein